MPGSILSKVSRAAVISVLPILCKRISRTFPTRVITTADGVTQRIIIMKEELTKDGEGNEWKRLIVGRDEVDIGIVLSCGQSFRWKNNGPDPSEWIGVFNHHAWILKQTDNDGVMYKVQPDLTSEKSEELLRNYFQLEVSLPELYEKWAKVDPKFASLTVSDYRGIRMLKQDPIENLFCFICSSNNNIIRISQMVEKLCNIYGEPIGTIYDKLYYDFPKLERLCEASVEQRLRDESFGYRAAFIVNSAKKIIELGGPEWVESLKKLSYDEARLELQKLPGIGRKVADCICLMSLGFPEAIPVDTHIHQVGKQYLPHLNQYKSLTDKVYSEISNYFKSMYGEYAGWAHSVLFASTLRHLKADSKTSSKPKKSKKRGAKTIAPEPDLSTEASPANPLKSAGLPEAKIIDESSRTVRVTRASNKRQRTD